MKDKIFNIIKKAYFSSNTIKTFNFFMDLYQEDRKSREYAEIPESFRYITISSNFDFEYEKHAVFKNKFKDEMSHEQWENFYELLSLAYKKSADNFSSRVFIEFYGVYYDSNSFSNFEISNFQENFHNYLKTDKKLKDEFESTIKIEKMYTYLMYEKMIENKNLNALFESLNYKIDSKNFYEERDYEMIANLLFMKYEDINLIIVSLKEVKEKQINGDNYDAIDSIINKISSNVEKKKIMKNINLEESNSKENNPYRKRM